MTRTPSKPLRLATVSVLCAAAVTSATLTGVTAVASAPADPQPTDPITAPAMPKATTLAWISSPAQVLSATRSASSSTVLAAVAHKGTPNTALITALYRARRDGATVAATTRPAPTSWTAKEARASWNLTVAAMPGGVGWWANYRTLPPILDVPAPKAAPGQPATPGAIKADAAWVSQWLKAAETATGRLPIWRTNATTAAALTQYAPGLARYSYWRTGTRAVTSGPLADTAPIATDTTVGAAAGLRGQVSRAQLAGPPTWLARIANGKRPQPPHPPVGSLLLTRRGPGGIHVTGWAVDPAHISQGPASLSIDPGTPAATTAPAPLVYSVDGPGSADPIAAAWPLTVGRHGLSAVLPATNGTHRVCLTLAGRALDCASVEVTTEPTGVLTVTHVPGGARVTGWALDPDTDAAATIELTGAAGAVIARAKADATGSVPAGFPGYSTEHWIDRIIPLPSGSYSACARVQDASAPSTPVNATNTPTPVTLTCTKVRVDVDPVGVYTTFASTPGGRLAVAGWAIDQDTLNPAKVLITATPSGTTTAKTLATITADVPWPGPDRMWPAYGTARGYAAEPKLPTGWSRACIVVRNTAGAGADKTVQCRAVWAGTGPTGKIAVTSPSSRTLRIAGWAISGTTANPIAVVVTLDGKATPAARVMARSTTPPAANLALSPSFAPWGPGHYIDTTVPATAGKHQVCISLATGTNATPVPLSCKNVTVK